MQTRFDYRTMRQLMLFAVVTQEKSIRKAAKRSNMSVPPLLAQLDELEDRLQVQLLERTPRGVRVTPEGAVLVPLVEQFLRQAEALSYSVNQMTKAASGVLTIGANAEAMIFFIPKLKRQLAANYPKISLFVKEIDSFQTETELTEGSISIGISFFDSLSDRRLKMRVLRMEKPIVVLGKEHRLARHREIEAKDLSGESFVFSRRSIAPRLFDGLVHFCESQGGFTPRIVHEVDSSPRQMAFVSCGQGIAFLPESFYPWMPPNVSAHTLKNAPATLPLSMAWNPLVLSPIRDVVLNEISQFFALHSVATELR